MWEFPKIRSSTIQTPNSKTLIRRTPTKKSPNLQEMPCHGHRCLPHSSACICQLCRAWQHLTRFLASSLNYWKIECLLMRASINSSWLSSWHCMHQIDAIRHDGALKNPLPLASCFACGSWSSPKPGAASCYGHHLRPRLWLQRSDAVRFLIVHLSHAASARLPRLPPPVSFGHVTRAHRTSIKLYGCSCKLGRSHLKEETNGCCAERSGQVGHRDWLLWRHRTLQLRKMVQSKRSQHLDAVTQLDAGRLRLTAVQPCKRAIRWGVACQNKRLETCQSRKMCLCQG